MISKKWLGHLGGCCHFHFHVRVSGECYLSIDIETFSFSFSFFCFAFFPPRSSFYHIFCSVTLVLDPPSRNTLPGKVPDSPRVISTPRISQPPIQIILNWATRFQAQSLEPPRLHIVYTSPHFPPTNNLILYLLPPPSSQNLHPTHLILDLDSRYPTRVTFQGLTTLQNFALLPAWLFGNSFRTP